MPQSTSSINYQLGSLYSVITAFLYATQEPFSFPAARHLNTLQFVALTQISLLVSIPLLLSRPTSRRDFAALFRKPANYGYLAVIFAIGMTGLLLYNFGLSNAHPIIISAILNLSPFWAALVALVLAAVLLWLLCRRVHRRDGGRLEPVRRRRRVDHRPTSGQFCPRQLGLRHSRAPLFRPRGNAGRQMACFLRRIGGDRGQFPHRERDPDSRLPRHPVLAK